MALRRGRSARPVRGSNATSSVARHGIARVLSKRGVCSRTQAAEWVRAGRVSVGGRIVRDPEFPLSLDQDDISVDGQPLASRAPLYLMLNKPRGLVTTASDERDRDTVYRCFDDALLDGMPLPWLAPVGRLDKASEGLLLFSNDPAWAARITDPTTGPDKTYHVQIDCIPDAASLAALVAGVDVDGERLRAVSVTLLRAGEKNAWLQVVLDEGRNRQIRRLLQAFGIATLRLVRVAIGGLVMGELPKGHWRALTDEDLCQLQRGGAY